MYRGLWPAPCLPVLIPGPGEMLHTCPGMDPGSWDHPAGMGTGCVQTTIFQGKSAQGWRGKSGLCRNGKMLKKRDNEKVVGAGRAPWEKWGFPEGQHLDSGVVVPFSYLHLCANESC